MDWIKEKIKNFAIGTVECICGRMNNVPYNIWCMKDVDYVMQIMSTYGNYHKPLYKTVETARTVGNNIVKFFYLDVFANHFAFRHCVDDNNHLRHMRPSIEETWLTHHWANRVFAFFLALSEVNTYLSVRYFVWSGGKRMTIHEFRRELALLMMNNNLDGNNENGDDDDGGVAQFRSRTRLSNSQGSHILCSAPPHAHWYKGPPKYKWICDTSSKYQQHRCSTRGCLENTRTYCLCDLSYWMCKYCHVNHCIEIRGGITFTDDGGSGSVIKKRKLFSNEK